MFRFGFVDCKLSGHFMKLPKYTCYNHRLAVVCNHGNHSVAKNTCFNNAGSWTAFSIILKVKVI